MRKIGRTLPMLMGVLSGLLTAAAFGGIPKAVMIFFSLIPLFIALLKCESPRQLKYILFPFAAAFYMPHMSFLYAASPLLPVADGWVAPLITLAVIGVSLLQGVLLWLPFRVCYMRIRSFDGTDVFRIATLYILTEWLTQVSPLFAFPYARLAVCLTGYPRFIGSAAVLGGLFPSFLILIVNGALALLIINAARPFRVLRTTGAVICLLSVNYAYGVYVVSGADFPAAGRCAVIQGNISSADKWRISSEESLYAFLRLAYGTADAGTDLIVFPETTVTEAVTENTLLLGRIKTLAEDKSSAVLTGTLYRSGGKLYNAMLAVNPDGSLSEPYFKRELVPFGEKVPFYSLLPESVRGSCQNFSAGSSSVPVEAAGVKIGGIICFESIYPQLSRSAVKSGAELLVVISNDSWFDGSNVPEQHFAHSVLRAVETGRYTICCSNTGISGVISPVGDCVRLPPQAEGALLSGYTPLRHRTPYSLWGDIIIIPAVLMVINGICKKLRE